LRERFRFFQLELLVYAHGWFLRATRKLQEPLDAMGRFWRLAALTAATEVIVALYVTGAFRTLG
jgi:hypothetical protein